jgi:hypothetical protein
MITLKYWISGVQDAEVVNSTPTLMEVKYGRENGVGVANNYRIQFHFPQQRSLKMGYYQKQLF